MPEPTITQTNAFHLAQGLLNERAALFERFRTATKKQAPDLRHITLGETAMALSPDNGR